MVLAKDALQPTPKLILPYQIHPQETILQKCSKLVTKIKVSLPKVHLEQAAVVRSAAERLRPRLQQANGFVGQLVKTVPPVVIGVVNVVQQRVVSWWRLLRALVLFIIFSITNGALKLIKGPKVVPDTFVGDCKKLCMTFWELIKAFFRGIWSAVGWGPGRVKWAVRKAKGTFSRVLRWLRSKDKSIDHDRFDSFVNGALLVNILTHV